MRAALEVAYVVDNLGGGGAQRQAVELAVRLRRERRIETRVVCYRRFDVRKRDPYSARLAEAGVPVELVEKSAKIDPGFPLRLGKVLRGCDIAHAFMPVPGLWTWLALGTLPRSDRPLLVAAERCMPSRNTRLDRAIQGFVYRRAAVVTANARPALTELATRLSLPADRLRYLPNGIDLAAWDREAGGDPPWPLDPDLFHVGLVGRLSFQKNQELLLTALARLPAEERRGWRVWLVGVGADTDEPELGARLRGQILREGLEGVVRLVPPTDHVAPLLKRLDLVVLPSRYEGFPNVVLEAMALGTLVAATAVGDVPSLLEDGITGLEVRPGDADDLLRVLQAARSLAPAERARITRQARLHVEEHYRIEAVADAYLDLYRSLVPLGGEGRLAS